MKREWLLIVLVLAGCFGKYKKGIVTEGADSFSGKAEIKWNGWLDLQSGASFGGEAAANMLIGSGVTVKNIDTTLIAAGSGQASAKITIKFGSVDNAGVAFKNEASIPWKLKNCKEIEVKVGSDSITKVPAVWDGKVEMGDSVSEIITADVPAKALDGLDSNGALAVRACGAIAASTPKQVESLKSWASKAALKPAAVPVKPTSSPSSSSAPAQ